MSESVSEDGDSDEGDAADELVLSYRLLEEGGAWGTPSSSYIERSLTDRSYVKQLLRKHAGPVAVDDEWEELLPCGCERPQDVRLRVEEVHGGDVFDEGTDVTVEPAADE